MMEVRVMVGLTIHFQRRAKVLGDLSGLWVVPLHLHLLFFSHVYVGYMYQEDCLFMYIQVHVYVSVYGHVRDRDLQQESALQQG